ncbi:MAG: hypothetical protein ACOCTR_01875 [Candidatus Natronoplasma sp.]
MNVLDEETVEEQNIDEEIPPAPEDQQQSTQGEQQPAQQQGYQYQSYQQYSTSSMFSADRIYQTLGMALVLAVVVMVVGGVMVSIGGYIEADDGDDVNLKENLRATGVLLGSIAVFFPAFVASFALFTAKDLSDQQKRDMILLAGLSLLAFAMLITTAFGGVASPW